MDTLHPNVEMAIDLAAHDVAKAISDIYGTQYAGRVFRNVAAMVRAAVSGSANEAGGWTKLSLSQPWTRSAADPLIEDERVLEMAIAKWWDTLDDTGKLGAIMGPAGHKKSEYVNNIKQKYVKKPETYLQKEAPELFDVYLAETGRTPAQQVVPIEKAVEERKDTIPPAAR